MKATWKTQQYRKCKARKSLSQCQSPEATTAHGLGNILLVFSKYAYQFSRSVVSDCLWPRESQHARPPCPSPTLGVHRSIPSLDGKKEYSPPNTLISDFRSAERILGVLSPWVCNSPRKQIHSLVRNGHWWWATWPGQQGLSKNRTQWVRMNGLNPSKL